MKKLIIIALCIVLAALAACSGSPVPEAAGAEGGSADGGSAPAAPSEFPNGGGDAPEDLQGGSEPFDGTAAPAFEAQYVRTDGYHENVGYPVVTVVSSKAALDAYFEENRGLYELSRGEQAGSASGFAGAIKKYDDDWFASHQLVIVLLEESSGSIRHEVESVTAGDSPSIVIRRLVPEVGTCDMAEWHILIELAANTFRPDARIPVTFVK
ncbi:MAG: hypothetical protein IIZ56_05980 [Clostridia bacterium]|nr:hypothetical protein [Clostridia bacterium]